MSVRLGVDGRELGTAPTGIGRYLTEVLRAAAARGWRCLVYGDGAPSAALPLAGLERRALRAPLTAWWDQVTLPAALRRDGVEVLLSPYYKAPLRSPCPVVITIHDLFFIDYPGRRRPLYDAVALRLARLYARRADAIVADSEHTRHAILARLHVPAAKVLVIPVALGPQFRPPAGPPAPARHGVPPGSILSVGNFKPHKNLPALLRAYAALPAGLRRAHTLVLAGGSENGRAGLEALAAGLGVREQVVFPGRIEEADLPAVYGGAAVLVIPSLDEGFGLPALEAMACGTPVVAGRAGALPEVVGDAAVLVDPRDGGALAAALAALLSDAARRDDLRRRGLARAAGFSPDRTAGRVVDLLAELAGPGRAALDVPPAERARRAP